MAISRPPSHEHAQPYPPDTILSLPNRLTFTRLSVLVILLIAVVDLLRVGFAETVIPYNYPFFLGVVYLVLAVLVHRRMHTLLDRVKREVVDITARTAQDQPSIERDADIDAEQIKRELERYVTLGFRPEIVLGGAALSGLFALVVMHSLDVIDAYPYLLMNVAYGAGHGLFTGPLLVMVWMVFRASNRYIVDIDVLAGDGMGGYRRVGDALVALITYAIVLVTFDFIILSSVSFIDEPLFRYAVFALYGGMLSFFLLFSVLGTLLIRRRLLRLRARRAALIREQLREVTDRYWEKQRRNEDPSPEEAHIQTIQSLYSRLNGMDLWPINVMSFARLALGFAGSLAVVAFETWAVAPAT